MSKLDGLIVDLENCKTIYAVTDGHSFNTKPRHDLEVLHRDTAAALRMLRDVAQAARDAQQTGRDLFLGTAGMHNVAEASKRIDTALAALRDAGLIGGA